MLDQSDVFVTELGVSPQAGGRELTCHGNDLQSEIPRQGDRTCHQHQDTKDKSHKTEVTLTYKQVLVGGFMKNETE
jgi:hypothetical protein